jgi:hypothetical protein
MGAMRKLWSRIFRKKESPVPPEGYLLHDPAAQRPHDLDDPYFDAKLQQRMGKAIGTAVEKAGPPNPKSGKG